MRIKQITQMLDLRKYATHLFTTPLSNLISDNMMLSRTLTKQFIDHQFTHFTIKKLKSFVYNASFKRTIFCCVRSSRRKCYNIYYVFSIRRHIFEKYPDKVKIVSHILKSLFYFKTCQNFKFR